MSDNPEINVHIDKIMDFDWTEDRHKYLTKLPEALAAKVLESLLPEQMQIIVNYRERQEDYIGDYLEYVWDSNERALGAT